jgi:Ku70/Ku80 beta-barrel domain
LRESARHALRRFAHVLAIRTSRQTLGAVLKRLGNTEFISVFNGSGIARLKAVVSLFSLARVIARGVLSFGLVSIPVDIHSAIEDQSIRKHLLHKKCGSRVRNQIICPVCNVVVERDDLVRGFELSKGNYVQITEEELESLEAEANNGIEFREFVPVEKIDRVYLKALII